MLAPTDYEIIEAKNGEEALATIAKQRPDLISDGCSATDHGWLHRNAPDKSRSRAPIDTDHRGQRGEGREGGGP
jgi:hypothetical protein